MTKASLLIAALLLSACSSGIDEEGSDANPVALVRLARAERGAITQQISLYGVVETGASGKQVLAAPADAIVAQILAPVGTRVSAGMIVVQLAPAPGTRLDLARAKTDAAAADAAFARATRLRGDGLVSDAEVEAARAAAASADATRASLSVRSGGLALRATAPGYVQTITANPGELLTAGSAVATIGRLGDVRARFGADPATARQLHVGMPMRLAAADGHAPIALAIASIDLAVDPQTRLASIFTRLPASAGFAAGETLHGHAGVAQSGGGLTIPYAALLDDGGQPFVYVVKGAVAHRHDVQTGAAAGDHIIIVKGIAAGDLVVTQGGTALEDGMKVRLR